ncbi:MAG: UDP-N-acetylmuramoyl-tripeptide--D-alanyl-D-alanine ligase [Armatimonadota bacterium]|nr:UDP-N-acetylmuramoyl-tripeptide--D-alanyl-D-alanine ligase [Armatimonadota bacterium]MDR7439630.1 UDP-N-acetylmuramoyl-tripeptide--D-alanyl-D-alanine ligase [Armatimonadota bacterium]MDR7563669.1 UDP-N-acetylmuramoyl-tripeptide--D-alanyl-D-alanine ligase [Armatimonadota bacterium]MDR7566772.1 UDP-N-acetylmuramoyl-tripeptide--D-alanyl-D-alanine ligase [Armatimonadota bacterium]MDR7601292.1 UDP-N-acetylmuramoyl-tripeptide--D-alanyl-D-alanine ligase [Armatimonadota bacterium]
MAGPEGWLTLAEVAAATRGETCGDPQTPVCGISVHSARVRSGDLFVALRGPRRDGHDFVQAAAAQGAAAALVCRPVEAKIPLVLVPDTTRALLPLGALWRSRFAVRAIGVTGSVGKTTTAQLIKSVLSSTFPVHASAPEWNAELGVPLTLFGLEATHRFVVVELGMRGEGQIRALCEAVRPEIGVVTNVGTAHLELLGSLEAIARAKAELVETLPEDGWAVLNADDPRVRAMGRRTRARVVFYGIEAGEVRAEDIRVEREGVRFVLCTPEGRFPASLPLPGRHFVSNALAGAAVGWVCGVPPEAVVSALRRFRPPRMRLEVWTTPGGVLLVHDAYNASPESLRAAFESVRVLREGRRLVAVLGEMRELGPVRETAHLETGRQCVEEGVTVLVAVGEGGALIARGALEAGMPEERILRVRDAQAAARCTVELVRPGDVVLVKASRAVGLERVAEALGWSG